MHSPLRRKQGILFCESNCVSSPQRGAHIYHGHLIPFPEGRKLKARPCRLKSLIIIMYMCLKNMYVFHSSCPFSCATKFVSRTDHTAVNYFCKYALSWRQYGPWRKSRSHGGIFANLCHSKLRHLRRNLVPTNCSGKIEALYYNIFSKGSVCHLSASGTKSSILSNEEDLPVCCPFRHGHPLWFPVLNNSASCTVFLCAFSHWYKLLLLFP